MTNIIVFTGNAGPGIASAAAASAIDSAARGRRTLLLSLTPPHSLSALLGAEVGGAPTAIAPQLDALAIDPLAEQAATWARGRGWLPAQLSQIGGDELPLLPGLEMSFGLLRLHALAPAYELVVLDAGPHDLLLRALALPDSLRWAVRQLLGLDRGPGRSAASVARAILPTSLLPADLLAGVQDVRVQAERLRGLLTTPNTAATYVLRPDQAALAEARIAIPALQLHGLAVSAIALGPLLPPGLGATPLARLAGQQSALVEEARAAWPGRPVAQFALHDDAAGLAGLAALGAQLHTAGPAADIVPIVEAWEGAPALAIELPGLPKNALQLTLSGDELIVRVGSYRRHILLPEALRGITAIKATRAGERLIVQQRKS